MPVSAEKARSVWPPCAAMVSTVRCFVLTLQQTTGISPGTAAYARSCGSTTSARTPPGLSLDMGEIYEIGGQTGIAMANRIGYASDVFFSQPHMAFNRAPICRCSSSVVLNPGKRRDRHRRLYTFVVGWPGKRRIHNHQISRSPGKNHVLTPVGFHIRTRALRPPNTGSEQRRCIVILNQVKCP